MSFSPRFLRLTLVALAAAALSACAGGLPGGLSVESVEFDASTSEVEFIGPVEAMASVSWTIGGVPVAITSETEIDAGLAVGDLAKVHAMVSSDTSLSAREIQAVEAPAAETADESPEAEVEFVGQVMAIAAETWGVGDQTLVITPETEIKDDIIVGDLVKVHAFAAPDGSLTAREIELSEDATGEAETPEDELHFSGLVETINPDNWVIGGTTFLVDLDTEIEDGIVLGDLVKVEATLQADGSYLAREIEFDNSGPGSSSADDQDTDFFGQVTAMDAGSWVVGGLTFVITPETEVKDVIALGDFVKVEAIVGADGSLTALEIELDDENDAFDDDDLDDDDDEDGEDDVDDGEEDSEADDDSGSSGSGGSDD
ncbi:MAG TPA: DUF5666 domain-containing protein [Anaerolineales bacterium]|nr:DUF5666 domain-containing protein [Anaerolineales bacterium]